MRKTIAYYYSDNKRSVHIRRAIARGARRFGYVVKEIHEKEYNPDIIFDVAIFYGLIGNLKRIRQDYTIAKKTSILLDLGYWGRHDGGRLEGYHRLAINGLHGADFVYDDAIRMPNDRIKKFNVNIDRYSTGDYILLCGQSAKAAWVYNMDPEQWERGMVEDIKEYTDMPIVYWPKNTWLGKKPIDGTIYNDIDDLQTLLRRAHTVVGHHSNSCMHGLLAGKQIYLDDGIAKNYTIKNITNIEKGEEEYSTETRQQFINKVSYCQWQVPEMRGGQMFKFLHNIGVL